MRLAAFGLLQIVAVACISALASGDARAEDDKAACVASHLSAQRLRNAGDQLAARGELRACSRETCPALVQDDCVVWLREVEASIPSVIVSLRTLAGKDLSDVRVLVDGHLIHERLTGLAIEVNPGERKFRLEPRGAPPVERTILINTGEKNRLLSIVLGDDAPGNEKVAASSKPGPPLVPVMLGAGGLAVAGVGIALDIAGTVALGDMRATCAPLCREADVDAARAKIIAGDTLLGVGVVMVGAAVILWLARGEPRPAPAPKSSMVERPLPFAITF